MELCLHFFSACLRSWLCNNSRWVAQSQLHCLVEKIQCSYDSIPGSDLSVYISHFVRRKWEIAKVGKNLNQLKEKKGKFLKWLVCRCANLNQSIVLIGCREIINPPPKVMTGEYIFKSTMFRASSMTIQDWFRKFKTFSVNLSRFHLFTFKSPYLLLYDISLKQNLLKLATNLSEGIPTQMTLHNLFAFQLSSH